MKMPWERFEPLAPHIDTSLRKAKPRPPCPECGAFMTWQPSKDRMGEGPGDDPRFVCGSCGHWEHTI